MRVIHEVRWGYLATWALVRRTFRKPFGTASLRGRTWLFPQMCVMVGLAGLYGSTLGSGGERWLTLALGVGLLTMGLALTARTGRLFDQGYFDPD